MSRRLKAVKDLSVLIVAPRRHDRQLWADLLKNCGINHPLAMSDIEQAATVVGSGQADVVFVDESYGAQGIAHILIPARNVEFSGGRGVCLVLCSKQATAADVLNARKLGFASLIILPASTDTIRKHLELAARYIPPSDEELGWSIPKPKEEADLPDLPAPKDDPQAEAHANSSQPSEGKSASGPGNGSGQTPNLADEQAAMTEAAQSQSGDDKLSKSASGNIDSASQDEAIASAEGLPGDCEDEGETKHPASHNEDLPDLPAMTSPGRSGGGAEEEVVFL